MKTWGLIVAAGSGERLGAGDPKAFRFVAGRPMLAWSLRAFERCAHIDGVVVVTPAGWGGRVSKMAEAHAPALDVLAIGGGETRQASVRAGLRAIPADVGAVVVHDAARPLVTPGAIARAVEALASAEGAVCALPVADTIKRAAYDRVAETVPRGDLWRAQTPQAFRIESLRDAHERALERGFEATDDAQVLEAAGRDVVLVPGDARNIKITVLEDLALAEALLAPAASAPARMGVGYDAHRFAPGRRLILGGVEIEWEAGLDGHSDADVVCHAIADALLGAANVGDIGTHFPSSDPRWAGVASTEFLRAVAGMVAEAGYSIASIDATVILQRPAIAAYRDGMRAALASALGVEVSRVSVKATTTDELGVTGSGEGAAAYATALLAVAPL